VKFSAYNLEDCYRFHVCSSRYSQGFIHNMQVCLLPISVPNVICLPEGSVTHVRYTERYSSFMPQRHHILPGWVYYRVAHQDLRVSSAIVAHASHCAATNCNKLKKNTVPRTSKTKYWSNFKRPTNFRTMMGLSVYMYGALANFRKVTISIMSVRLSVRKQ
jgi:hypothetical protein